MENSTQETNSKLISSFIEITSSTGDEAHFFLESHQWDLDSAVSTFLDNAADAAVAVPHPAVAPLPPHPSVVNSPSPSHSQSPSASPSSPSMSPSRSASRSRSASPVPARDPYPLRSRRRPERKQEEQKKNPASGTRGGIRTLADLNRTPPGGSDSDDDDDDEPQRYYTGGEKSGMLVQDPTRGNDVDAIFDQARHSAVDGPPDHLRPSSSSKAFTGTARLLSGESVSSAPSAPSPPEVVSHNITFWRNGFTVDNGPLRRLDDPANASFLESIRKSECPKELAPADRRTRVHCELGRREEDFSEPPKRRSAFQGASRTLGSDNPTAAAAEPSVAATPFNTAPTPSLGLVVDSSLPTTSIQLRLADGTRMVSRFNHHHTISDIHAFIDASRPGGSRDYQLQAMGFPPKQLTNPNQTIEEAGIANSVVMQKL